MDFDTAVFASVFPILKLSHTTPTPLAPSDVGHGAAAALSPYVHSIHRGDLHRGIDGATQRALRRTQAWSCATRFLGLPKDVTSAPRLHRTRDVDDALTYLLVGEGRSDAKGDEGLLEWYTNECRLHFAERVRPALDELWGNEISLRQAWEVLDQSQAMLERAQDFYREPWDEHILPVLKESVSVAMRPSRPMQVADADAVEAADWKFRRDIHAVFAHCLAPLRYSKTLSYVLYDAGCKLFRIHTRQDGVHSTAPHNTREFRQRMTQLLQGLERVGLGGDAAQKAFAHAMTKLLDSFITSHYLKVDWYSNKSIVPHLRLWIRDGFCPLVELVLECLKCEPSSIMPTEVASWQDMALGRLGRSRVDNLFDFVINWDKSLGAILDIKDYLKVPGAKQHLTSSFSQQISRRLLHPGATTTYILNVYISIIRSFHELEPKGVLLERVARPIRRYLKERDDTARIIISSLLTDLSDETGGKFSSNSELSYEIASEMAKPFANYGQEADEELNWGDMNWQPLPQDASPEYKKSKVEDVIWFLLTLWERDDFINELKNILGDHLLRCQDLEYEKEIRLLELIKVRLGDDKLQACEVMLRDVLDSRRINASIRAASNATPAAAFTTPDNRGPHTPDGLHPHTPQPRRPKASSSRLAPSTPAPAPESAGPALNAQILSSFFWPLLRDDTFRVPEQISTLQKDYEARFERIKGMRKLRWMNALGSGSITLTFDDRTEHFDNLTPWQVSVVHAFEPQQDETHVATRVTNGGEGITRSISQLEDLLDMDESLVRQATAFWTGKSVLRATGPDTYAIIERLPSSTTLSSTDASAARAAEERAALQEAAQPAAVKTQADLLEEKKGVYNAFIVGMLTAQGNMPTARIAMMMRMMVQGGFPFGEKEVAELLGALEEEGKVVALGGGTWGVGK